MGLSGKSRYKGFRRQKLVGVNLTDADLTGCDFTQTIFESCHLNGAIVNEETIFDGADLRGAQISNLHLEKSRLKGAIMSTTQAHDLLSETYGIVIADN